MTPAPAPHQVAHPLPECIVRFDNQAEATGAIFRKLDAIDGKLSNGINSRLTTVCEQVRFQWWLIAGTGGMVVADILRRWIQ